MLRINFSLNLSALRVATNRYEQFSFITSNKNRTTNTTMNSQPKKTNYFYIDESGSINNDSKIFIHGCIKTDSPTELTSALKQLKQELLDTLYYDDFITRIKEEGFHATENNMDMKADFYKLLPILNYRSYFVIVNKETEYFEKLKAEKEEHEIFALTLDKLLKDRIEKNKDDKNIFIFETIQISKKSLENILKDMFDSLDSSYDCEYRIVGKEEENMSVVDYLNFIFNHILTNEKPMKRMFQNFELIAPKIAVIYLLNNEVYLSRKRKKHQKINIENLFYEFGGKSG